MTETDSGRSVPWQIHDGISGLIVEDMGSLISVRIYLTDPVYISMNNVWIINWDIYQCNIKDYNSDFYQLNKGYFIGNVYLSFGEVFPI